MTENLTLLTDYYELTMMDGYIKSGIADRKAVFDIFFRPKDELNYAVFAGLEQAIDYLTNIRFTKSDIDYLRTTGLGEELLTRLANYRFTGNIRSVREGDVVFPYEPIFIVESSIFEAQLLETALLTLLNHQTLIATKAARVVSVAGSNVMEFGLRRAQGADAGTLGARAAYVAGCSGTSNVLCGKKFGIPVLGTLAHSFIMCFDSEIEAFRAYANANPDNCLLLVDTYDTLRSGIPNALKVFDELRAKGHEPKGIRLDSGDFAYLTKKARKMLDDGGYPDAKICISGDLDEYAIDSLLSQGAKIDSYGVGTKLITSENAPSLGGVYKLSAVYDEDGVEQPVIKISENPAKITNPGNKKFVRIYDNDGKALADLIMLKDETIDESKPLTIFHPAETYRRTTFEAGAYKAREMLVDVIKEGKRVYPRFTLDELKSYCAEQKETFWSEYTRLYKPHIYKVDLSERLWELKNKLLSKNQY